MKKRILLLMLTLVMIASVIPFNALGFVSNYNLDYGLNVPHEELGSVTLDQYVYSCNICNYENVKYIPSADHDFTDGEIVKIPECEVDVMRCECHGCGTVYFQALSAEGHIPVVSHGRPANCTEIGYTEGEICLNCDAIIVYQEAIPTTESHTWGKSVITKAPTCTAGGVRTFTCTACKTAVKTESITAIGHSYTNATCSAPKTCKVCKATSGSKLSHKSDGGKIVKKATYNTTGTKVYSCTLCKARIKTETIAKLAKTSLKKAKVTVKAQTYSGKAKKPDVTVKLGSKTLKKDTDYTVTYKNNKKIGKATVTVTGINKYKDSVKTTFKINPKTVSKLSLKSSKKKQLTVSWKKDTNVSGYEIVYATNSKFTKGKKTVKVTSYKTYKKTLKSLNSKKTYYVKVRAYKTVSGKKYYGKYCSYKKLKIK